MSRHVVIGVMIAVMSWCPALAPAATARPLSLSLPLSLPLRLPLSLSLAPALTLPLPAGEGSAAPLVAPLPPPLTVVTPFNPPAHRYGAGHRGVDLGAAAGSMVRAAGGGIVVYAGRLVDRGVVSIEHPGGLRTTYEPVTASVTVGEVVSTGAAIGTLQPGHARCAPTDCLHFGARMPDRTYLDPLALLRTWQVRLKPWDSF